MVKKATKGRKIAQESYIKYWFHLTRYYRATFEYEVDGKTYQAEPFPEFIQNIIRKGGLLASLKED